ncbi:hypothetical protein SDC9_172947 [bioreactor metagenome]|uniref:Uncharacterized protein n=1 Tax=bioreactor metagenome TaxID=1076179 RepID=A0A645GFR4_9ZZZZ
MQQYFFEVRERLRRPEYPALRRTDIDLRRLRTGSLSGVAKREYSFYPAVFMRDPQVFIRKLRIAQPVTERKEHFLVRAVVIPVADKHALPIFHNALLPEIRM